MSCCTLTSRHRARVWTSTQRCVGHLVSVGPSVQFCITCRNCLCAHLQSAMQLVASIATTVADQMQNANLDTPVLLRGLEKLVRTSPDKARQVGALPRRAPETASGAGPQSSLPKTKPQMAASTAAPTPELARNASERQAPAASAPPPCPAASTDASGLRSDGLKAALQREDVWRAWQGQSILAHSTAADELGDLAVPRQVEGQAGRQRHSYRGARHCRSGEVHTTR